ncbi:MAG: N-6 DNA methylase [Atopobiaceae bacterium]|nr:N-6 DNA methylase [Atopobiaceae bacterium]
MMDSTQSNLGQAVFDIAQAANNSANEEQLKVAIEGVLRTLCVSHDVFWNPYTLEKSFLGGRKRLDVVHGAVVIEYEPPRSFNAKINAQLRHARKQVEEYSVLLSSEEGRAIEEYTLIVFDGVTIDYGKWTQGSVVWETQKPFDKEDLVRVLRSIEENGNPLVSPALLTQIVGPDTKVGRALLPALYKLVVAACDSKETTRTKLIFTEWERLFGEVDGDATSRLDDYLRQISKEHSVEYSHNPQAYVFALNTYIAIVAKLVSAFTLQVSREFIQNQSLPTLDFFELVERGDFFADSGIKNMLSVDFFSWYVSEEGSDQLVEGLSLLLNELRLVNFDITRKSPSSVRDLFKGLYMGFTPSALRHALGEYYTPDWLADHVVNCSGWKTEESFLDPTCGSGTFVLEALKRRIEKASPEDTAEKLLDGLFGFDLNPLAVLTTRASIVVFLSDRFDAAHPVLLPIYLADAINTADPIMGTFRHSFLTERGERSFLIPEALARDDEFYDVMNSLKNLIDGDASSDKCLKSLTRFISVRNLSSLDSAHLAETVGSLVSLHKDHWNGIWCSILFDRIAAGCVHDIDAVVGNPPWVKWSNLPRAYAEFIKPICNDMEIFSEDTWVGGIQSDISTVVFYKDFGRFVKRGGTLAFLITGSVFKNESSQGFRRWTLVHQDDSGEIVKEPFSVSFVEDYQAVKPFDGVAANWPTLIVARRDGSSTGYPVPYRRWAPGIASSKHYSDDAEFSESCEREDLVAIPVPGTDAGPWLDGCPADIQIWNQLFTRHGESSEYAARKGITTDANGIYFVDTSEAHGCSGMVRVANNPDNGRRRDIRRLATEIETDCVYPLLKGRGISRFNASVGQHSGVIVPQTGMSGDEDLPVNCPSTFGFLSQFKKVLIQRSSYRRFQQGKPYWSVWSTGPYTFSPYKVVWKEMSGRNFVAAYVGSVAINGMDKRVVVPDHKVYFVPVETLEEAAYLCGFLNAPIVSRAISSYAPALSLGTSVTEYLAIPPFNKDCREMRELSDLAIAITEGDTSYDDEGDSLSLLVDSLLHEE